MLPIFVFTDAFYDFAIGTLPSTVTNLTILNCLGESWGLLHRDKSFVFVDDHNTQRGEGFQGHKILSYHESNEYKVSKVGNAIQTILLIHVCSRLLLFFNEVSLLHVDN